jgi:dTDP-4-amino-4,6-dideoxygalactose transaminase
MNGLSIPFTGLRKQYNNLRSEILDATDEVLRSGSLMNGNYTAEFESWLAKKNGVKYAITVGSGTAALECMAEYYAVHASAMPPRVLIPSLTYAATANAFQRAGWDIHFVDTDNQGLFDFRDVPQDLSFQAVVLVGLYGADIAHLGEIRQWRRWIIDDLVVIEDAAQHWLSAGCVRMGRASAISFDPMKNLAAYGNGGAVVTNDSDLLHFARAWRDNGKTTHDSTGTNSRMSELDCALLLVKCRHLDAWQQRRAVICKYWMERLRNSGIRCLINKENFGDHAYHKFVIDIDQRDTVQKNLASKNIETRVHYKQPLHELGVFRQWAGPDILSCSSALSRRVLSLPIYPELTDLQVDYVADQVLDCVNSSGCNTMAYDANHDHS